MTRTMWIILIAAVVVFLAYRAGYLDKLLNKPAGVDS